MVFVVEAPTAMANSPINSSLLRHLLTLNQVIASGNVCRMKRTFFSSV
jgi:hypothetical protein